MVNIQCYYYHHDHSDQIIGFWFVGDLTEWTKCKHFVAEPKRRPFKVPDDLKDEFGFLSKYKYKPRTRIIKYIAPSVSSKIIKKSDEVDG